MGDLNDVAWSPTALTLMKSGDLLDPTRGRGFYNTYPARWTGLRYPLDYVFNTRHFDICSMKVLPAFGSDHLSLIAERNLRAEQRADRNRNDCLRRECAVTTHSAAARCTISSPRVGRRHPTFYSAGTAGSTLAVLDGGLR
jgi:hypothetical protein